jgi:hypothetical protein
VFSVDFVIMTLATLTLGAARWEYDLERAPRWRRRTRRARAGAGRPPHGASGRGMSTQRARARAATEAIASLDGIRALAVSLVFLAHSGLERRVPGGLGVHDLLRAERIPDHHADAARARRTRHARPRRVLPQALAAPDAAPVRGRRPASRGRALGLVQGSSPGRGCSPCCSTTATTS